MTKPANRCEDCIHFSTDLIAGSCETDVLCEKGHRPRFYMPRNHNPYDDLAGWKRRCNDFEGYEDRT